MVRWGEVVKRLVLALLLCAGAVFGQPSGGIPPRPQRVLFANLGTPQDSNWRFCADCAATAPCTGGGSGAFAYRVGSTWNCNVGTSGGANTALSNLASTAVNTDIVPNSIGTRSLGTTGFPWSSMALKTSSGRIVWVSALGGNFGFNYIQYNDGTGPCIYDDNANGGNGASLCHNLQSLTATRNITWSNASGTVALTASKLSVFAATTSAELATVLSDEVGSGGGFLRATAPIVSSPTINTGLTSGTGFQHTRAASCTTGVLVNASCDTTITWPVAFADANYTTAATLDSPTGGLVFVLNTKNKTATTIDVTLVTLTAAASAGTINLIGIHDP